MGYFNKKRVLITGATGLIGYSLVQRLMQEEGINVVVMGRSKEKLVKTFDNYVECDNFETIAHDVSEVFPESLGKVDVVFHAAGPMERDIVLNKPVYVILPNVLGTINTMEYVKKQEEKNGIKARVILFSSVTVYSNNTSADRTVKEEDTNIAGFLHEPTISYSESKRMTEVIATSYTKQFGIDAVIARFSTVYGYTKNIPDTAFFEFIRKAITGEDIILNGSNMPRRDNIYVDDAISALMCLCEKGVSGETYNISSNGDGGNFAAVDEIAKVISEQTAKITGKPPVVVSLPNKKGGSRKPGLRLCNDKIKALGSCIGTNMSEGIYATIKELV